MIATLAVIVFAAIMALCTVAALFPKHGGDNIDNSSLFPATHTVEPHDE